MSTTINLYPRKFSYRDDEGNFQNMTFEYIDRHLWSYVEVHESVTVRTLMEIMKYPSLSFWQHALTEPLLPELFEYYEEYLEVKSQSSLDAVLFHWHGEFWEWKDPEKSKDDNEIHIGLDMSGFVEKDSENESGIYGLTFTSLKELVDVPIRIDKNFKIWVLGDKYESRNEPFSFGERTPTLIELMKAFVYEVTFLGTEDDKTEQLEEMQQTMEDIETGKAKLRKFEDIKDFKRHIDEQTEQDDDEEFPV